MRFSCRITKASVAQWGFVINTAFGWQKWLAETPECYVKNTLWVLQIQSKRMYSVVSFTFYETTVFNFHPVATETYSVQFQTTPPTHIIV